MRVFLVVNGLKAIKEYEKVFKSLVKEYKKIYKGWGYTYKEVIPKGAKKPYYYWYKWEYNSDTQNNVWTYIGKDKPLVEIPDPPKSNLEDIEYDIAGENVIITEEEYSKILDIFSSYQKFEIQAVS